ncbi:MAG: hypothetical protein LBS26_04505 [Campylobacteraceae bacterium]|jgi:hypothetical protein|nr:hypothetical protein [Campylobacteraceae bacterium]
MRLHVKNYLAYRLFNSLFLGLSVGTVFIIYEPLMPSVYSLGGIFLALGMIVVAYQYKKLMNKKAFFWVLLAVETVTFVIIFTFLFLGKSLLSALIIYICYQVTFLFGSYTVRVETVVLKHTKLYSLSDIIKQIGYLLGLGTAFVYYKAVEFNGISDKISQVYFLHYMLIAVQVTVIFLLIISFVRKK